MKSGSISYGKLTIDYEVQYTLRKTLEIAVLPDCQVVITAPEGIEDEKITEKVRKRARWILKQKEFFQQFQPKTPPRNYLIGETHLYLGRRYRLQIQEDLQERVELSFGKLRVFCKSQSDPELVKRLLTIWYRQKAHIKFNERLNYHLANYSEFQKYNPILQIRTMNKRWGSLSPKGMLTLNLNLIKAPVDCIDYVIVHELCHLIQPNHGPKFYRILKKIMPDYQKIKLKLELKLI